MRVCVGGGGGGGLQACTLQNLNPESHINSKLITVDDRT